MLSVVNKVECHKLNNVPETITELVRRSSDAQLRLFEYLKRKHLKKGQLIGPDIGVRWNKVLFHLMKSYLRFLPWRDQFLFCQTQGYWIKVNKAKYELSGNKVFFRHVVDTADDLLERQTPQGYWPHPLKEWEGRASTVEGDFAALGLIDAYGLTGQSTYLSAAEKWLDYLIQHTGFQNGDDWLAINYFSNIPGGVVPDNATLTILLFTRAASLGLKRKLSDYIDGMVRFLLKSQKESGELPYVVATDSGRGRPHYQCFQYNSFEFLDLCEAMDFVNLPEPHAYLVKQAQFLSTGVGVRGECYFACGKPFPNVLYHSAAIGAALLEASMREMGDYWEKAARAYKFVLDRQRSDGSFPWSEREYLLFKDERNYPHNLVMLLWHLWMLSSLGDDL